MNEYDIFDFSRCGEGQLSILSWLSWRENGKVSGIMELCCLSAKNKRHEPTKNKVKTKFFAVHCLLTSCTGDCISCRYVTQIKHKKEILRESYEL